MNYRKVRAGEWVRPTMKGYLMKCCGCGLVHRMNFKVIRWGRGHKVLFQASRHEPKRSKEPKS